MQPLYRSLRCWCVAIVAIVWARPAAAYRPFNGTDAGVAQLGEVELEVGPAGYRQEGSSRFVVAPALVANYGFARNFEAVAEGRQDFALGRARPGSQVQDLSLSVKSVLRSGSLQGDAGVSVALEVGLLVPGFDTGWGTHLGSIFTYRLPAFAVHLNLTNDLFYSEQYEAGADSILEGPDAWRLRPVAELIGERAFGQSKGVAESALFGGIFRCSDAVSLDAAARFASEEGQRAVEGRAGFTWVFEVWRAQAPH